MPLELWIPFFLANLAVSISPGMGALAVVNAGLTRGPGSALRVVLGLQLALVLQLLIVALGTDWLRQHRDTYSLIRELGALYLCWLGLTQLKAAWRQSPSPLPLTHSTNGPRQETWRGLWVNLANPKALIFMFALVPQFIRPDAPLPGQYLIIGCTTVLTDTLVMGSYGLLAAKLKPWLTSPRAERWRNGLFGGLFLLLSLGLLLAEAHHP